MKARSHRSFCSPRGPLAGTFLALVWLSSTAARAQDAAPAAPPAAAPPAAAPAAKGAERRKSLLEKVDAARNKRLGPVKNAALPGAAAGAAPAAAPGAAPVATPVAAPPVERDPPGAVPNPPSTMEKIAQATDVPFRAKPGGHLVKFNL